MNADIGLAVSANACPLSFSYNPTMRKSMHRSCDYYIGSTMHHQGCVPNTSQTRLMKHTKDAISTQATGKRHQVCHLLRSSAILVEHDTALAEYVLQDRSPFPGPMVFCQGSCRRATPSLVSASIQHHMRI